MPGAVTLLKLAVLLGVAGSSAYLAVSWNKPASEESAGEVSSASSRFSPSDPSRFYLPVSGRRYIYTFERAIAFEGNFAGTALPAVAYKGEFFVDVLRADARAFEALVSQRIEGGQSSATVVRIEADARGDQLSLFTDKNNGETEKEHTQILKDLVALWLFPLRSDTVGAFEARFESLPHAERKTKITYLSKGNNIPEILSSSHLLQWNSAIHLPGALKGQETTRFSAANNSPLSAASRYELKFRAFEPIPHYSRTLLASLSEPADLLLQPRKPDLSSHPDYAKLSWPALSAQLASLEKMNGGEQLGVFGDLLKFLRMHPEKLADVASMLRDPALLKAGIHSPLFKTLVGALATLGSVEALEILRNTYEDPSLNDQARTTILASLTTTQAPIDAATRDFLAQKMQAEKDARLAQTAAFALGSALQNAGQDAQSARAITQIENAWAAQAQGGSVGQQLALLDVMGNSGRAEFYPSVQAVYAGENSAILRARAVFALRFMNSSAATQDLISRLSDPAPQVREAAANAIAHATWKESFRAPLESCAGSETVAKVQSSCRNALAQNGRLASN